MSTRALLVALAMGGVMAGAVLICTRAYADTVDDVYVESLHSVGISSGHGDAGLIVLGHIVCNAFGIGESFSDVETLILTNNPGLGSDGAAQLIGAGTAAYCPAYAWKFGGIPPSTVSVPHGRGVLA